jgi:hypothetical protein
MKIHEVMEYSQTDGEAIRMCNLSEDSHNPQQGYASETGPTACLSDTAIGGTPDELQELCCFIVKWRAVALR